MVTAYLPLGDSQRDATKGDAMAESRYGEPLFDLRMETPDGNEFVKTFASMEEATEAANDWIGQGDTSVVRETLIEVRPHEHQWGEWETSRITGTPFRLCLAGMICGVVSLDEDDDGEDDGEDDREDDGEPNDDDNDDKPLPEDLIPEPILPDPIPEPHIVVGHSHAWEKASDLAQETGLPWTVEMDPRDLREHTGAGKASFLVSVDVEQLQIEMAEDFALAKVEALEDDEDAYTWLDQDPSVAWEDQDRETYHGRLRAIYESVGWESCYHDHGRALFHFNVKLNGNDSYRGVWDAINAADLDEDATDRVEDLVQRFQDQDLETFWFDDVQDFVKYDLKGTGKVYSCGRSGGYAQPEKSIVTDPVTMVKLATFLTRTRRGFNSREYGMGLVEMALEEYKDQRMAELASPRIERIEA
jgi:hypothetical protein